jgi:multidrug efflux pump
VRVELNPNALNKYGIGLEEVRNTITQTNTNRPKGVLESGAERGQIQANDQARKAEDYLPLIVSYRNGVAVKIGDLGTVEDSVEDVRNTGLKNGDPSVLIILRKQPLANVIQTVDQVKAVLPELRAAIPSTIDLSVVSRICGDFISGSIGVITDFTDHHANAMRTLVKQGKTHPWSYLSSDWSGF